MKRHTERIIRCLDFSKTTQIADLYEAERTNRRFYK